MMDMTRTTREKSAKVTNINKSVIKSESSRGVKLKLLSYNGKRKKQRRRRRRNVPQIRFT